MDLSVCCIGGSGRCGTTILRSLYSRHPDVAAIPECRITVDPGGLIDYYSSLKANWSPYLFHRKTKQLICFLEGLSKRSVPPGRLGKAILICPYLRNLIPENSTIGISKYCPEYDELVKDLESDLVEFRFSGRWVGMKRFEKEEMLFAESKALSGRIASDLGKFYMAFASRIAKSQGATHFVEDNTWNFIHFDYLVDIIPSARLVHIYRDPRDVVASYMKQSWAPSEPVKAALFLRSLLRRWQDVKSSLLDDSFMEISLSELVGQPNETLKSICRFWELPWHDSLLTTKLDASNSGRWKRELDAGSASKVEEILSDEIDKYGDD